MEMTENVSKIERSAVSSAHDRVLEIGARQPADLGKVNESYFDALDALYQAQQKSTAKRQELIDQH